MKRKSGYRFCPSCGHGLRLEQLTEGEPQRLVCGKCRQVLYLDPKTVACVITLLNGKIVLQQRKGRCDKGKWVIPGGFVDLGETVEEAGARELWEETSLHVKVGDLLGVFSYPGETNIVIVYEGSVVGGELQAGVESMSVDLFSPENLPWDLMAFQTTRDALRLFLSKNYPHL